MLMNEKQLLSIIIPLYNVAPWLTECLDSLLTGIANTGKAVEIILFDDTSTDETTSIAEDYTNRFPEVIRFLHWEKNQGPGATRNEAMRFAEGEYIWFFDGDDRIEENLVLSIFEKISDHPDVIYISAVFFNGEKQWSDGEEYRIQEYKSDFGNDIHLDDDSRYQAMLLPFAPWRLVFRRACITGVAFCPTDFTEDLYFFLKILVAAEFLSFVADYHVQYRRRKGQLTARNHPSLWSVTDTFSFIMNDIILPKNSEQMWSIFFQRFHIKLRHIHLNHLAAYSPLFRYKIRRFWCSIPEKKRRNYLQTIRIDKKVEYYAISFCLFPEFAVLLQLLKYLWKALQYIHIIPERVKLKKINAQNSS